MGKHRKKKIPNIYLNYNFNSTRLQLISIKFNYINFNLVILQFNSEL